MQRWRERIVPLAAIASDVGLFGCVLYFIILTKLADTTAVNFAGWFIGLCLLYLLNEKILEKGTTLRSYAWWNLFWGSALCAAAFFGFKVEPFSVWGWFWYYGLFIASVVHCAYISLNKIKKSTSLMYLDGTIPALILVQIWEHLGRGGKSSELGAYLVFCIGMNFLAILTAALSEHTEQNNYGEDKARGSFPTAVPVVFLGILVVGMLLSVLFGKGISSVLVGIVLGAADLIWGVLKKLFLLVERFFLWLATFADTTESDGLLGEASQQLDFQTGNVETSTLPGWVFAMVIVVAALLLLGIVFYIGKMRIRRVSLSAGKTMSEPVVRRKSSNIFLLLWNKLKEKVIFAYRYMFHPEDIRVLVACAENYGKHRKMGREKGETLRMYFARLKEVEEVSEFARRLGEIAELYYYAGSAPVLSKEEGRCIRKKFSIRKI